MLRLVHVLICSGKEMYQFDSLVFKESMFLWGLAYFSKLYCHRTEEPYGKHFMNMEKRDVYSLNKKQD